MHLADEGQQQLDDFLAVRLRVPLGGGDLGVGLLLQMVDVAVLVAEVLFRVGLELGGALVLVLVDLGVGLLASPLQKGHSVSSRLGNDLFGLLLGLEELLDAWLRHDVVCVVLFVLGLREGEKTQKTEFFFGFEFKIH